MRALLLAAALLLPATPAFAQRPGTYDVIGVNANGSEYRGRATLQALEAGTFAMTWVVAGQTFRGVGLVVDGLLVLGYSTGGTAAVATYRPQPDGTLVGPWTTGRGRVGSERLVPR